MTLYRFDVFDGTRECLIGPIALADPVDARREALSIAAGILHERAERFDSPLGWRINASNEAGALIFQIRFTTNQDRRDV